MTLSDLVAWVSGVPAALPEEMRPMAQSICESFQTVAKRLMDLGLGYLALDRAAATLSTGERQRMQLARAVRNRTTGVLYVLDEPSIGLHPANITGLTGVMQDLIHDGNSVILVDHDTQILSEADWLIEMGPQAGAGGGQVIAQGSIPAIEANAASRIGPFLAGKAQCLRPQAPQSELFALGRIQLSTNAIHTVKPLDIEIPKGRLTVVTGVSGSGKTTLVLESLVPGLNAAIHGQKLPEHVRSIVPDGITQVKLIDAAPIGINVRSTVATYANVHDELRKSLPPPRMPGRPGIKRAIFPTTRASCAAPCAMAPAASAWMYSFLPDVEIPCPNAAVPAMPRRPGRFFTPASPEPDIPCRLAVLFACFCVLASFGMGNMSQINSIAGNLQAVFRVPPVATGIVLALLTGRVILGGLKRVAAVTEAIVPLMALFYLFGALTVVCVHWAAVPAAFAAIFRGAFGLQAAGGGVLGYGMARAISWGFKRGAFSNEAGLGASVLVHCAANVEEPVQQGMWGMFEVFADTMVVCTLTALVVLTSGLVDLDTGAALTGVEGSALVGQAFSTVFGAFGPQFIAVSVLLFAYSTTLGWSHYGTRAVVYLLGERAAAGYKLVFAAMVLVGAVMKLDLAWALSDTFNGLMMLPNLVGVVGLSGVVARETQAYLKRK